MSMAQAAQAAAAAGGGPATTDTSMEESGGDDQDLAYGWLFLGFFEISFSVICSCRLPLKLCFCQ